MIKNVCLPFSVIKHLTLAHHVHRIVIVVLVLKEHATFQQEFVLHAKVTLTVRVHYLFARLIQLIVLNLLECVLFADLILIVHRQLDIVN